MTVTRPRPSFVASRRRETTPLREAIEKIQPHAHICLLYATKAEQFAAVVPYLRLGIERGERCVYIVDENTAEEVLRAMKDDGVDAAAAVKSGALAVITKRDSYLKDGFFDPDRMIRFLEESVAQAQSRGYAALRVTGEMTWALGAETGVERLIEYESKLNGVFPRLKVSAICQYNRNRFSPALVKEVIHTHPYVISGGVVAKNPFFIPVEEYLSPAQPVVEVERLLENITAFEKSQEALQASGERFRELVESMTDWIWEVDEKGVYTYAGPQVRGMLGYAPEEVLGKTPFDLMPADEAGCFSEVFKAAVAARKPLMSIENRTLHKDGHVVVLETTGAPILDRTGSLRGYLGIDRDITARKRTEEALRRANVYNRSLIEASLDLLVIVSPEGKITDVNRAAELATGRTREDLIGSNFSDHFTDTARARDAYQRAFHEGRVQDCDLEVRRNDGSVIPVLNNAAIFKDEKGRVAGVIAAARDVTALKRAQDEIRRLNTELEERVRVRTAQVEAANKELEAFTYSVSHDLRAPLRTMDGFSQILMEDYAPKLEPECRRYLGLVRKGAQTMGYLIDDLLAFSRLGRQAMIKSSVDMGEVVRAAIERLKDQAQGRRVTFKTGELAPCEGDFALLTQVWVNLIANALKFTSARPEAVIEIDSHDEAGETVYRIKDNGVGFDMRYVDKLFKVFQRLHPKEEYEGTGVGLAIVARIIERHGGRAWARGEIDRGAEFFFTLGGRKS